MSITVTKTAPPVVHDITITLNEKDAGLLMRYIEENGSWENDKGGNTAERVWEALFDAGVRED